MADLSIIRIDGVDYNIKDSAARAELGKLGALAYKNSVSGNITPSGTVTLNAPTASVKVVDGVGSLPGWTASVNNEVLSFSWNAGSLPTTTTKTVVTAVNNVKFTGNSQEVTLS